MASGRLAPTRTTNDVTVLSAAKMYRLDSVRQALVLISLPVNWTTRSPGGGQQGGEAEVAREGHTCPHQQIPGPSFGPTSMSETRKMTSSPHQPLRWF